MRFLVNVFGDMLRTHEFKPAPKGYVIINTAGKQCEWRWLLETEIALKAEPSMLFDYLRNVCCRVFFVAFVVVADVFDCNSFKRQRLNNGARKSFDRISPAKPINNSIVALIRFGFLSWANNH